MIEKLEKDIVYRFKYTYNHRTGNQTLDFICILNNDYKDNYTLDILSKGGTGEWASNTFNWNKIYGFENFTILSDNRDK